VEVMGVVPVNGAERQRGPVTDPAFRQTQSAISAPHKLNQCRNTVEEPFSGISPDLHQLRREREFVSLIGVWSSHRAGLDLELHDTRTALAQPQLKSREQLLAQSVTGNVVRLYSCAEFDPPIRSEGELAAR